MEDFIKKQYQPAIDLLCDILEQKNSRIKELETENKNALDLLTDIKQYGRLKNGVFIYTNTDGENFVNKLAEAF